MAIPELPAAPDPATDNPTDFNLKAAAYVLAQKALPGQINDALGQFNAAQAGGVYALPYVFDTATADADPGPGKLRLSSATQNTATVLRLDVLAGIQDMSAVLDTFDASTSAVKGSVKLVKMGDLTKWLTFDVSARAAPSGYRNLTITNTGSSSANPFVAGDGLLLFFQRNGDKGNAGDLLSPMMYVREEYAGGVNATNYVNNGIRILNSVVTNTISGASISSNVVTLPAGTYDIEGNAPIYAGGDLKHRVHLQNGSTFLNIAIGTTEYTYNGVTRSFVRCRVTFSAATQIRLTQVHATTSASGGLAINAGVNEVYAELMIRKVA